MAYDTAPVITAEHAPAPPGRASVAEVMDTSPPLPPALDGTRGEALAFALPAGAPAIPPAWQPLAEWSSAPAPAFGGAANAIHFYLNHRDGIGYQGFMHFKPASPPYGHLSRNRFYGTGHVYPNVPWGELYKSLGPSAPENMPAPWVRLVIALRAATAIAGLTFHQAGGSGSLPAGQVGWAEEDVRDLLGSSPHFVTSLGPWVLYLETTTQLL
jgi:hypothetical protein